VCVCRCVLYFATGAVARQCDLVCCPSLEGRCADNGETVIVVDNIYILFQIGNALLQARSRVFKDVCVCVLMFHRAF
jgi:hypothetical protein